MRRTRTLTNRGGRTCGVVAVVLGIGLAGAAPLAAQTATKCAIAKSKAAGKKVTSKLKCHQRSFASGLPVDPACLLAAETKFDTAMARIEARGGCAVIGDGATIETVVDACVESINALTPITTPGCPVVGSPCGSKLRWRAVRLPRHPERHHERLHRRCHSPGGACASDEDCGTGSVCFPFLVGKPSCFPLCP